jgi:hypothetical protein
MQSIQGADALLADLRPVRGPDGQADGNAIPHVLGYRMQLLDDAARNCTTLILEQGRQVSLCTRCCCDPLPLRT